MHAAPAPERIRICLLDDHKILLEGLARMLASEQDMAVVAQCNTVSEALAASDRDNVDLFLIDLRLNGQNGFAFLETFKTNNRKGRVLILAGQADDEEVVRLAGLGAAGIVLKNSAPELLFQCIRKAAIGEPCFSAHHMAVILRSLSAADSSHEKSSFSAREEDALRGLLEGFSNKKIAEHMGIPESSVKYIMQNLLRKTGLHSRSQLVRFALEQYHEKL